MRRRRWVAGGEAAGDGDGAHLPREAHFRPGQPAWCEVARPGERRVEHTDVAHAGGREESDDLSADPAGAVDAHAGLAAAFERRHHAVEGG
ncbi:hypothetical protein AB0K18_41605 [Nonomuraea sp. NPDC049421]|uniref:hypothetical protein n=1 Tax=Nonomuraea sp. NPDC049421 TaxID=3155275 RepID=UPI003446A986